MRYIVMASVLAAVPAAATGAQPVDTFAELAQRIELGQPVTVTVDHRDHLVGRALHVTPTTLTIMRAGVPLQLDAASVTRVRQPWADPVGDGARRGFLFGSIPVAAVFLHFVEEEGGFTLGESARGVLVLAGLSGALGAWFGALADAGVQEQRDIYRAPPRSRATLAPLLSKDAIGASVTVTW